MLRESWVLKPHCTYICQFPTPFTFGWPPMCMEISIHTATHLRSLLLSCKIFATCCIYNILRGSDGESHHRIFGLLINSYFCSHLRQIYFLWPQLYLHFLCSISLFTIIKCTTSCWLLLTFMKLLQHINTLPKHVLFCFCNSYSSKPNAFASCSIY